MSDLNRRSVLHSLGVATAGSVLSTQAVTARRSRHDSSGGSGGGGGGGHSDECSHRRSEIKQRLPDYDVTRLSGRERNQAMRDAQTDQGFKKIRKRFVRNGWQPDRSKARASYTVADNGTEYTSVVVPFKVPAHQEAYVRWTTHPEFPAEGFHSVHFDKSGDGTHDHWRISAYRIDSESGDVTTNTRVLENFLGCDNVNWGCVTDIAGAYLEIFGACAVCSAWGAMVLPACAACVGAVVVNLNEMFCEYCSD